MHTLASSFVLGYHGCDRGVAENLLSGEDFKISNNEYDWLGPGIYFWEANPKRGLEFAEEIKAAKRGPKIKTPAVIGAIIELGLCLDMTTSAGIFQVKDAYAALVEISEEADRPLPQNSNDLLRRYLDRAVLELLHRVRKDVGEPPIDTVKGVFIEGSEIYPTSGFSDKTHIQICVCNPERIKGVFRVPNRFLT